MSMAERDETELNDLGTAILMRLRYESLRACFSNPSADSIVPILKKALRHHSSATALILRDSLGVRWGGDIDDAAMMVAFLFTNSTTPLKRGTVEMTSTGARIWIDDCQDSLEGEEGCIYSREYLEGFVQTVCPESELCVLQRMAGGDKQCLFVLKERGTDIMEVLEDDTLACVVPPFTMEDGQWRTLIKGGLAEEFLIHMRALEEVLGPGDAIKVVRPFMQDAARKILPKIQGALPSGSKNDPEAALALLNIALGQSGMSFIPGPGTIGSEIVQCPFKGAPVVACRAFEVFVDALCRALDPMAGFRYDSMMSSGAAKCRWSLRLVPKECALEEMPIVTKGEPQEDPVRILNLRLAKGEIALADYRILLEILKGTGK